MTSVAEVMIGLECLTNRNLIYKSECRERQCPYRDKDCELAVMEDAYNLLDKYRVEIDPPRHE